MNQDHEQTAIDLLESSHSFPGSYQIKVIGSADDDFVERVLAAVVSELLAESSIDHKVRSTPGGRHVAITLQVHVQSAQQVRNIYKSVNEVRGLAYLL